MKLSTRGDSRCLPTHAGGSSVASLEAMATGLPLRVGTAARPSREDAYNVSRQRRGVVVVVVEQEARQR